MPIYEYECTKCLEQYEVPQYTSKPYSSKCPECNSAGRLIPSITGYRRDHTLYEDHTVNGDSANE